MSVVRDSPCSCVCGACLRRAHRRRGRGGLGVCDVFVPLTVCGLCVHVCVAVCVCVSTVCAGGRWVCLCVEMGRWGGDFEPSGVVGSLPSDPPDTTEREASSHRHPRPGTLGKPLCEVTWTEGMGTPSGPGEPRP